MNTISKFEPADRYKYDFQICTASKGWAQIDTLQDAPYFGTWTNPFELQILSYTEGDVKICTAESVEEYIAELNSIKKWNEENGYGFAIDPLCNKKLIARFQELGLQEMLH